MYVPNPIRCRKCLKLGHFADSCIKSPICGFCSEISHPGNECKTIIPTCVNCGQNHHSLDFKCPRFIEEKEVKAIQFKDKITYAAAKRKYRETNGTAGKSYAGIVKNKRKVVEVGCQTEDFTSISINTNNATTVSLSKYPVGTGLTSLHSSITPLPCPSTSTALPPSTPLPPQPLSPRPAQAPSPPSTPLPALSPSPVHSPSTPCPTAPSPTTDGAFPTSPPPPSPSANLPSLDHNPEEKDDNFKTPPVPKGNMSNRPPRKTRQKNNKAKSEDEMETN